MTGKDPAAGVSIVAQIVSLEQSTDGLFGQLRFDALVNRHFVRQRAGLLHEPVELGFRPLDGPSITNNMPETISSGKRGSRRLSKGG